MTRELCGEIVQVLIGRQAKPTTLGERRSATGADYLIAAPVTQVRATLEGFEGDRHGGLTRRADARAPFYPRGTEIRNSRQVSLVAEEELAEIAEDLGVAAIEPGWLGANLVTRGIPCLSRLPAGTRLFFPQRATLVIAEENHPCALPGRVLQGRYPDEARLGARFVRAAQGRRGLVGWVERAGMIATGDRVEVVLPPADEYDAAVAGSSGG